MTLSTWRELALYESRDYIARRMQERHNCVLDEVRCLEIVSHVAQGRQYFESARNAGNLVRPLLLYYGVLALSRAIILSLQHPESGEGLEKNHGLKLSLSPNLAEPTLIDSLRSLEEMRVSVLAKGTFPQLCAATKNCERWESLTVANNSLFQHHHNVFGSERVPAGTVIDLKSVLCRLPDTDILYTLQEALNEPPASYFVYMRPYAGYEFQLEILSLGYEPPDEMKTRAVLGDAAEDLSAARISLDAAEWAYRNRLFFQKDEPVLRISNVRDISYLEKLPGGSLRNDDQRNSYLVFDLSDNLRLSTLATFYVISYMAGMLVRYYPPLAHALMTQHPGDRLNPVLLDAVALIERRFPALVFERLNDNGTDAERVS